MNLTPCACNRSAAVLGGFFASLAACVLVAEGRCRGAGGRVSEASWACDLANGASSPLWSLVTPGVMALTVLAVGVPVFLVVNAVGRRLIVACGLPAD